MTITILLALLVYTIALLILSFRHRKTTSLYDYSMAGGQAGPFAVSASLFTLIGGGELVTLTSLSFSFGMAALSLFFGYALSFAFIGIVCARLRSHDPTASDFSLPDYVARTVGPRSSYLAFLLSFLAFFSVLVLQFIAIGDVLSPLTGFTNTQILGYVAITIAAYLLLGGFRAVLSTDVLQAAAMLILLPIILAILIGESSSLSLAPSGDSMPVSLWLSLTIAGFFGGAASADVWQRALAARSDRIARVGFITGAAALLGYGILLSLLGSMGHALGAPSGEEAFVYVLTRSLPAWSLPIAALLVFCTIMSTADTQIFLLAGLAQRQHRREFSGPGGAEIRWFRLLILAVLSLSCFFAIVFDDIILIYTWLFSIFTIASPIFVATIFWPLSDRLTVLLLAANAGTFLALYSLELVSLETTYVLCLTGLGFHALATSLHWSKRRRSIHQPKSRS